MARSGEWERGVLHGQVPEHPTPQVAGTQYFAMDVDEVPATGSRPDRPRWRQAAGVGPAALSGPDRRHRARAADS